MPSLRFSNITFLSAASSLKMQRNTPTHHGCNHGDVSTMAAWHHTKMMPQSSMVFVVQGYYKENMACHKGFIVCHKHFVAQPT